MKINQNIIFRNLKRKEFLGEVINSFKERKLSFNRLEANNQLVFINILEGIHNPNTKPVEQYAIRDESGKMIMNNILIFEIYIPDLIMMMQRNHELFLPDELVMDTYQIEEHLDTENVSDEKVHEDDSFKFTNTYIGNEKE